MKKMQILNDFEYLKISRIAFFKSTQNTFFVITTQNLSCQFLFRLLYSSITACMTNAWLMMQKKKIGLDCDSARHWQKAKGWL